MAINQQAAFGAGLASIYGIGARLLTTPDGTHAAGVKGTTRPVEALKACEVIEQRVMYAPPEASVLPCDHASPAGFAGAKSKLLRQHRPRDAGFQDKDDAGEH